MKREDYQKVKKIFQSALDIEPSKRPGFLDESCRDDKVARGEVEKLLKSVESGFLEESAVNEMSEMLESEGSAIGRSVGHYDILEKIGEGGMGVVYLAEDKNLGRRVAIKFLNEEFSRDPDKLARFVREAKAASALNHPNILTVFEIGDIDGRKYIATEFIDGKTLREHLFTVERISLDSILKIGGQISEALSAAHQAGIIHRDIKPDNVMIRDDGYAKILDFGLAKLVETEKVGSESLTRAQVHTTPGMVMGTVSYMSPEQARGQETDARTDIWSLGVVLYEMLATGLPFEGDTTSDTIVAILEKEPPVLENVPDELQRIIRKTLTKAKDMRYQSAKELFIDLKNLRKQLEVQGELDRSVEPVRSVGGSSFEENTTRFYDSIKQTNPEVEPRQSLITGLGKSFGFWRIALTLLVVGSVIGSLIWWYSGGTGPAPPGLMKSAGIISWSSGPNELNTSASFSPDAKMVAFGSARSGATEIWVKPAIGGEAIQVTKNGFYNQYPVWSPNGQDLVYYSSRGDKHGIWRVSFTGGEQTEIAADVAIGAKPSRWAKSGKIYFQADIDLFAVDESSGKVKAVTDFELTGLNPRAISLSPDESMVVFSIKENDIWKLKVKQLKGAEVDEIATSGEQIDNIAWEPDNIGVIFSGSIGGTYQIFRASIKGGEPVQLSNGNLDFFVEDVSDDGSRILYSSLNETSDLWMVNAQDQKESLLANDEASEFWADVSPDSGSVVYQSVETVDRPFAGSINVKSISDAGVPLKIAVSGFSPVWSRDGKWIAYFRRTEKDWEIWRVSQTGGDAQKLTSGGLQIPGYTVTPYALIGVNHLSWSPVSDELAYAATRDGKSNIWVVTADGLQDEKKTGNEDPEETFCCPAWTGDGTAIVASSRKKSIEPAGGSVSRLSVFSTESFGKKMIFEGGERIRFLGLGSGGKEAVFCVIPDSVGASLTAESIAVKLVSLESGALRTMKPLENAYAHNIHLSPDGTSIAYVARRGDLTEIWNVPVGSGLPQKLVAENDPKIFISSLAWAPNGSAIVFGRQTRNNLLSMLVKDSLN